MTLVLEDLFDGKRLRREMEDGYVTQRFHPTAPLAVLNYTSAAQYDQHWNEITKQCRGLIYNTTTSEVVARPWSKFMNWDQSNGQYPPPGPMLLAEKFDGSMGVVFINPVTNNFEVATRGSFTSSQAIHATRRLHEQLDELGREIRNYNIGQLSNPFKTYLFEIIAPWNRVVCDYGDRDELVLLDVIDIETGRQDIQRFEDFAWPTKAEKILVPGGFSHSIIDLIPEGNEGFVLSWPERGFMCKMKAARYLELHRLVFGLSKKSIWEQMLRSKSLDEIKEPLPDEFYDFVDKTYSELINTIEDQLLEINLAWARINEKLNLARDAAGGKVLPEVRKAFASVVQQEHKLLAKYLFKLLDGATINDIRQMILETLKPIGDTHVKHTSEDTN